MVKSNLRAQTNPAFKPGSLCFSVGRLFQIDLLEFESLRPLGPVSLDGLLEDDLGLVQTASKEEPAWTLGQEVEGDDGDEDGDGQSDFEVRPVLKASCITSFLVDAKK